MLTANFQKDEVDSLKRLGKLQANIIFITDFGKNS